MHKNNIKEKKKKLGQKYNSSLLVFLHAGVVFLSIFHYVYDG